MPLDITYVYLSTSILYVVVKELGLSFVSNKGSPGKIGVGSVDYKLTSYPSGSDRCTWHADACSTLALTLTEWA